MPTKVHGARPFIGFLYELGRFLKRLLGFT